MKSDNFFGDTLYTYVKCMAIWENALTYLKKRKCLQRNGKKYTRRYTELYRPQLIILVIKIKFILEKYMKL